MCRRRPVSGPRLRAVRLTHSQSSSLSRYSAASPYTAQRTDWSLPEPPAGRPLACLGRRMSRLGNDWCICSGIRVARSGTRDEIRSFRKRPGPRATTALVSPTRCSAAASGVAWPGPRPSRRPDLPNSGRCIPNCHAIACMSQFGQPSVRLHKDECRQVPYRPCRLPQYVPAMICCRLGRRD